MSAALAERAGADLDQGARKALYKGDLLFGLFQGRMGLECLVTRKASYSSFLASSYLTLSWVGGLKLPFSLSKFLQEVFFLYISFFHIAVLLKVCLQLNSAVHWSLKIMRTLTVV